MPGASKTSRTVSAQRRQGELFPSIPPALEKQQDSKLGELISRYTFDSFVVGASNQFAHAAAKAVATHPAKQYNPLFLYGGVGLGKTHLVNAIGHHILRNGSAMRVAYLPAEAFTSQLINSLQLDRMQAFKNTFRRVDVLILEDVQFLAGRERTQEEFFHTFNELHANRRQIILTSDKVPRDISGLEERLRNRFEWGLIADIQPPDIETRVAILQRKADLNSLRLPREVAMYIATNVSSNVRELEGCLTRLGAYASIAKHAITLEFARQVLDEVMISRDAKLTPEMIQAGVASLFGIRVRDILSRKRSRDVVLPRQVAMYLTRKLTNASFPAIGERFGGRDHSTVIHACSLIEQRVTADEKLREIIQEITQRVQSRRI